MPAERYVDVSCLMNERAAMMSAMSATSLLRLRAAKITLRER